MARGPLLTQDLGDGSRQGGLAVVDVADGADLVTMCVGVFLLGFAARSV